MGPFYPTLIILRASQRGVKHEEAAAGAWCVNIVNKGFTVGKHRRFHQFHSILDTLLVTDKGFFVLQTKHGLNGMHASSS